MKNDKNRNDLLKAIQGNGKPVNPTAPAIPPRPVQKSDTTAKPVLTSQTPTIQQNISELRKSVTEGNLDKANAIAKQLSTADLNKQQIQQVQEIEHSLPPITAKKPPKRKKEDFISSIDINYSNNNLEAVTKLCTQIAQADNITNDEVIDILNHIYDKEYEAGRDNYESMPYKELLRREDSTMSEKDFNNYENQIRDFFKDENNNELDKLLQLDKELACYYYPTKDQLNNLSRMIKNQCDIVPRDILDEMYILTEAKKLNKNSIKEKPITPASDANNHSHTHTHTEIISKKPVGFMNYIKETAKTTAKTVTDRVAHNTHSPLDIRNKMAKVLRDIVNGANKRLKKAAPKSKTSRKGD